MRRYGEEQENPDMNNQTDVGLIRKVWIFQLLSRRPASWSGCL